MLTSTIIYTSLLTEKWHYQLQVVDGYTAYLYTVILYSSNNEKCNSEISVHGQAIALKKLSMRLIFIRLRGIQLETNPSWMRGMEDL